MKYSVSLKKNKLSVKVHLSRNDKLSEVQVTRFVGTVTPGFLTIEKIEKHQVVYGGNCVCSLKKYLSQPLTSIHFFCLLAQIVTHINLAQKDGLILSNLVFDPQYIFVNDSTGLEIFFIYLPLETSFVGVDVLEFIKFILFQVKLDTSCKSETIPNFISFLSTLQGYDGVAILSYIEKQEPGVIRWIKGRQSSMATSGYLTNNLLNAIQHYGQSRTTSKGSETEKTIGNARYVTDSEEETTLLCSQNEEETTLLENDYEEEETSLLDSSSYIEQVHYPRLERMSNGESIEITRTPFSLGKSNCDYIITGNLAVSRTHAYIVNHEFGYGLQDNESKNGSFVNDVVANPGQVIALKDATKIVLANEEFMFYE